MFGCQSADSREELKRVWWVQWWFWKYGSSEALLWSSDKKRTPEFVAEIQAMIDNYPSKSIRSKVRDMGVWVFYQAGSTKRYSVFLIQDEKTPIFYHRPRRTKVKTTQQSFWTKSINTSDQTCFGFSLGFECQQVSSSHQDSFPYSGQS